MTIVKEIAEHFASYPAFTYRDVKLYLTSNRIGTRGLPRLISYMKSKGTIHTIRKGAYTLSNNVMVSGFAYSPFYYGLLSALTIRELWTQNSRPDIMTVKKVRNSRLYAFGGKEDIIFAHHIPMRYFFGYDIVDYGKLKVPVSDPEKTLIDLFYYKVRLAIQNYSGLLRAVNRKKLREYLKAYDERTAKRVLDFVKEYKAPADAGKLESPY
jgi:predicted transcriptional regulator of viral defense system